MLLHVEIPDTAVSILRTDVRYAILKNRNEDGELTVPHEYQEFLFRIYEALLEADPEIIAMRERHARKYASTKAVIIRVDKKGSQ